MILLPGTKFIIEELMMPTNKLLIKKGSTGFTSIPTSIPRGRPRGRIARQYNPELPITYTVFFTKVGKSGKDRITWSRLRVLHVKPHAKDTDKFRGLDHLVRVRTETVNLADVKSNEFIAYLLSCYYYIAHTLHFFAGLPPRGILDNREAFDIIDETAREGMGNLTRYSNLDWFYILLQKISVNIESMHNLLIRYDHSNPNVETHREDEIIELRKCLARYGLVIRKHLNSTLNLRDINGYYGIPSSIKFIMAALNNL